jgi:hypothetical protein
MASWSQRKRAIIERDKKCVKCGSTENLTVDHIIPIVRGGGNEPLNLQTLCEKCNQRKAWRIEWGWLDRIIMALHVDDHLERMRNELIGWKATVSNQLGDRIKSIINAHMGEVNKKLDNALAVKTKENLELFKRIKAMEDYHGISFHEEVAPGGSIVKYNKVKVPRKKRTTTSK